MSAAPYRPPPPLEGLKLVVSTIALSAATFMNVLDTSIANVSIPAISGDLGVAPNQGTWVITSFAVATGISLPLTGWLTQRFGAVKLFTLSVMLFVLMSWLCGVAPSIELLIVFRILQGVVAGPMIPLSQSLLLASYRKEAAGFALAMWSITTLVAPIIGPLLGGWITDNINWQWIFYINVPVGIVAAGATWLLYRDRETPTVRRPVDVIGLALLIVWVGCFQIVLDKGKELDWFQAWETWALTITAIIAFCFFLVWELTDDHPIVDLQLLRRRNFWVATLTVALGYSVFFGNLVILPLWLQQNMGYTATLAGVATAPVGILAILISPWVGKNIGHSDARLFATVGFVIFAFVMWMRSGLNTDADFHAILVPTVLQGAAMAFFFVPLMNLALSGLPPEKIPSASGLFNFLRITAGAFGASVATTMWDNRAAFHRAFLSESIDHTNASLAASMDVLREQGWSGTARLAEVEVMLRQQAYMLAANDVFYSGALLFMFLFLVVWLARPANVRATAAVDAGGAH
ncbi:MAG: DHA2 family efflux MFS transporter permease subunit [Gammaproteobacteria bacterium]|nr:DHA2 family efflux MFS transporter permease subunit [Gammaproteobacteria bacterium]MBI5614960.1 DHA2 family efflux MFS transporter permease subunit [Gammaproteobacteria bacterium]